MKLRIYEATIQPKFKVGNHVKCINPERGTWIYNERGIVVEVFEDTKYGIMYYVRIELPYSHETVSCREAELIRDEAGSRYAHLRKLYGEAYNTQVTPISHETIGKSPFKDDTYAFKYDKDLITVNSTVMSKEMNFPEGLVLTKGIFLDFMVNDSFEKEEGELADMNKALYVLNCVKYVLDRIIDNSIQYITFSCDPQDKAKTKLYDSATKRMQKMYGFSRARVWRDIGLGYNRYLLFKANAEDFAFSDMRKR